ncbi:interleukin-8-like [Sceloporus undulatus]|uniref:interleukin-8-like n=1 Tax=Sceloporus undulatus TaxID=8520 RepID=UPI001C4B0AC2|nr:interleukin-8-like [Sceloporus undulatus]
MSQCPPALLLSLLLLLLAKQQAQAAPMTGELRCRCIEKISEVIPPKRIANIELTPEGPHCSVSEVIATLKSGKEVCLDPSARWVKLIISRILKQVPSKL